MDTNDIANLIKAALETTEEGMPQTYDTGDFANAALMVAVDLWLIVNSPCADPGCRDCAPVSTSWERMKMLHHLVDEYAQTSEYMTSEHDSLAGHA